MNEDFLAKLMIDVPPTLKKHSLYFFEIESGHVYGVDEKTKLHYEYPLRQGYSQYLWLLKACGQRYLREVKS